jgi:hypothetical protein
VPALDSTGATNVTCDTGGALRLWVTPYWSSQSQLGGAGPGTNATLLELDAVSGGEAAFAWSLIVSADGNTLEVAAQTGDGIQTVLETPISWQSGVSHCVILDYNPGNGTTLFLDGAPAAQGGGVPSVPVSVGQLTIGSTISGANTAGADIDEFSSFDRLLTNSDAAGYYMMVGPIAALGLVSLQVQTEMDTIHTPGNVYDPGYETSCSTGGKPFITNILATVQTNGLMTVTFEIYGTNGVLYDIFATSDLIDDMSSNQWTWIGETEACTVVSFSNEPAGQSFYTLEITAETFTIAFDGNDSSNQLATPSGLSNAIAIAAGGYFSVALTNIGGVIAWGDNTYGETTVPAGLTNVVGVAAGQYHGVVLLANGSVTNWGHYYDGTNHYSVTNRSEATAPPTSSVAAVAAGQTQDLALMSNGTVVAWGEINANGTQVPTNLNLTNVAAIACGWGFNVALSSNGTVTGLQRHLQYNQCSQRSNHQYRRHRCRWL